MKRIFTFIILLLSFVVLMHPGTEAQWYKPHGSYQRYETYSSNPWEGAEVAELFYNISDKKILALCIDEEDNLFLFYQQWKWDPQVQPYRDSLYVMTKSKGGEWSQPEKIGYSPFDLAGYDKYLGYDIKSGVTHIFYTSYPYLGCAESLYYTNSTIPNWEPIRIDSLSTEKNEEYGSLAIAFDSCSNVHIAWQVHFDSVRSDWYKVLYANNSTGEWIKQQVSQPLSSGGFRIEEQRFTVEKDGTVHMLYNEAPWITDFYARNDSLNGVTWFKDTIPKPSISFYSYGGRIITDGNSRVHLFTEGCEDGECNSGYFNYYYYKQSKDSTWTGPEPTYQPDADDLSYWWGFVDGEDRVHVSLVKMGYVVPTHDYFYTNNTLKSWIEPFQILYTEEYWAQDFRFVIDSGDKGHGVFIGYEFDIHWDTSGIYYMSATTGAEDEGGQNKDFRFDLFQNFPNPFNTSTMINYELKEDSYVKLDIYNLLGQKVRILEDGELSKGWHSIKWDGKDNNGKEVASGIYLYKLATGDYKQSKRLVLIK